MIEQLTEEEQNRLVMALTESEVARVAAESECAALRAKLIDREEKFVAKHAQLVAAESRLADANALLTRALNRIDRHAYYWIVQDIEGYFSSQGTK